MNRHVTILLILTLLLSCLSASAEGQLVVYYSHAVDWSSPIIEAFEKQYRVDVELVSLGTNRCLNRIQAEAKRPQADIIWGGVVESYLASMDLLASYHSPEVAHLRDGMYDDKEFRWFAFDLEPMVLIYNTRVSPTPTGWEDLLRETFKGKIAVADPVKSSSSFAGLMAIMSAYGMDGGKGYEFQQKLIDNLEGRVLASSSAVYRTVVSGKNLVGITYEEAALRCRANGDPIEIVYPKEGTHLFMSPVAIVKGAPNPRNAQMFVDYLLSEEVQSTLSGLYRRSARKDIEMPQGMPSTDDIPLSEYDIDWVVENIGEFIAFWDQRTESE